MLDSIQQSVRAFVSRHGDKLRRATPMAITAGLSAAALAPVIFGEFDIPVPVLQGLFGLAGSLGESVLYDLVTAFKEKFQADPAADKEAAGENLETEIRNRLESGGPEADALRDGLSQVLQKTRGLDVALAAATGEVRLALSQGLAEMALQFREFRWMLDGLQQVLLEVRARQAEQLALQKEQLDLQREQLVKTSLLLQLHQGAPAAPAPPAAGPAAEAPADVPCPYKGLAPFQPEDAEFFFGREEVVAQMIARLAGSRFLAVVGPSGSGKSSAVRAGLLPALWQGALPGSGGWKTVILTPGARPLEELAARAAALTGLPAVGLLRGLESDPRALDLALRGFHPSLPEGGRVLLVVDQFEEAFVLCRDEAERRGFVEALTLAGGADHGRTVVVLALRADFYGRGLAYEGLARALAEDNISIGPLSEAELRRAIEAPAARAGLRLEPVLVDTLVAEALGEPGALPLLSHALLETWKRRRGATLTLAGYAEAGGMSGAVARTADAVLAGLDEPRRAAARAVLLRLTELGETSALDTRRRARRADLVPEGAAGPLVEEVIRTLADARLLTIGEDTVEVAHEALIRQWPTLQKWLNENRESLRVHHQLAEDAAEWAAIGRDAGGLYRGLRLAQAWDWSQGRGADLNALEREFLAASRAQQQDELDRERRRAEQLRRRALALGGALALACALLGLAVFLNTRATAERNEARRQARRALAGALTAQSGRLLDDQLDLGLLLAAEAYRLEDSPTSRGALLGALVHNPCLLSFLHGHSGPVPALAYRPDGRWIASGGYDGAIRIWDAATGQAVGPPLTGHDGAVCGLAWSPDGRRLASGGDDGTVRLWDAAAGRASGMPLTGHEAAVWGVAWSPDGSRLATASRDGTVRLWDAATGRAIGHPLTGHDGAVYAVAFRPDGRMLASAGYDKTIRLWDPAAGAPVGPPLTGHERVVWCLAWSPDGTRLASGGTDAAVRLWDPEKRIPLGGPLAGHTDAVTGVAWGPDGRWLASSSMDRTVRLWDAATGRPLGPPLGGQAASLYSLALRPGGAELATGTMDGPVLRWQPSAVPAIGRELADTPPMAILALRFEEAAGGILAADARGLIRRWDKAGTRPERVILEGNPSAPVTAAFSRDGRCAATADLQGRIRFWDAAGGKPRGAPAAGHNGPVWQLSFSPDGRQCASVGQDATLRIWDAGTGHPRMAPITVPETDAWCVGWSPDGRTLAVGCAEGVLRFYDAARGLASGEPLQGHALAVLSLSWRPDGRVLATGGLDRTVRLWDAVRREPIGPPLRGHAEGVLRLTFSADGHWLASGDRGGTIRLWDARTGQPVGPPLPGYSGEIRALTFSPDGLHLAGADSHGHLQVWDLRPGAWRDRALRRAGRGLTAEEQRQFLGPLPQQ